MPRNRTYSIQGNSRLLPSSNGFVGPAVSGQQLVSIYLSLYECLYRYIYYICRVSSISSILQPDSAGQKSSFQSFISFPSLIAYQFYMYKGIDLYLFLHFNLGRAEIRFDEKNLPIKISRRLSIQRFGNIFEACSLINPG